MSNDVQQHMKQAKRTQVAQTAVDFSQYFASVFQHVTVAGGAPRRPVLVAPGGMSTEGGRRARQGITLEPTVAGFSTITIGWLDVASRAARLRTHGCLEQMHRARFQNRPFDLDPTSYQTFIAQAQQLFLSYGIHCTLETNPPDIAPERTGEAENVAWTTASVIWVAVLFFLIGGGSGAALMWIYMSR